MKELKSCKVGQSQNFQKVFAEKRKRKIQKYLENRELYTYVHVQKIVKYFEVIKHFKISEIF